MDMSMRLHGFAIFCSRCHVSREKGEHNTTLLARWEKPFYTKTWRRKEKKEQTNTDRQTDCPSCPVDDKAVLLLTNQGCLCIYQAWFQSSSLCHNSKTLNLNFCASCGKDILCVMNGDGCSRNVQSERTEHRTIINPTSPLAFEVD